MADPEVGQLAVLADLFGSLVERLRPTSVAVLGIAGGNGLERLDAGTTNRVVGVDINPRYLDEVQCRFGSLLSLELYCTDLTSAGVRALPVELVHAALLFEHTGLGRALDNALSLVAAGGLFSAVLQLPSKQEQDVASTGFVSIQALKQEFALIDASDLERILRERGFRLEGQVTRPLPAGKALWLGVFGRLDAVK